MEQLGEQVVDGHRLDVRENVVFEGGYLSQWVHERYPEQGCALAVELKKVFMDEWTGVPDDRHLDELTAAFEASVPLLLGRPGLPGGGLLSALSPDDLAVDRAAGGPGRGLPVLARPHAGRPARCACVLRGDRPGAHASATATWRTTRPSPPSGWPPCPWTRWPIPPWRACCSPSTASCASSSRCSSAAAPTASSRLSIELYGAVGAELLAEAEAILEQVPDPGPEEGPWLDAAAVAKAAQAELDRYRAFAPDLESHVEVREGSTGVMVSNGDVLVAPTCQVPVGRLEALLHHEVGTHVVTHVNGAAQPLHVLASGLAGHDETQEGLAVLAEHLVGGLTARRLRQLAGRVVAVHAMVEQAPFEEVHATLVARGIPDHQAFSITMRVFRAGGLTKDAVYLRGLRELVDHLSRGADLDVLWLGKMPLSAAPLVADLHARGELRDPLLQPRYLDDPATQDRLAALHEVASLAQLTGAAA